MWFNVPPLRGLRRPARLKTSRAWTIFVASSRLDSRKNAFFFRRALHRIGLLLLTIALEAISGTSQAQVISGSYTGNATDGRSITGVGFQPDVVIVKSASTGIAVLRTSSMSGDNTKPMTGATALTANQIQSLTSDGFTVGTDSAVNASSTTYY